MDAQRRRPTGPIRRRDRGGGDSRSWRSGRWPAMNEARALAGLRTRSRSCRPRRRPTCSRSIGRPLRRRRAPRRGRCAAVARGGEVLGRRHRARWWRGWDETVDGPARTVWTPVTSSWLEIARAAPGGPGRAGLIPAQVGHVASGATGDRDAAADGRGDGVAHRADRVARPVRPGQRPAGMGPLRAPRVGPFKLGKTNPNFSTSGLNALIGEYYAATGTSSDLTVDVIADPARRAVRARASSPRSSTTATSRSRSWRTCAAPTKRATG